MQYGNFIIVAETIRAICKRTIVTVIYCPFAWLIMTAFVLTEPVLQQFIEVNHPPFLPASDNAVIGIGYLAVLSLVIIHVISRTKWVDGQRALSAFCVVYLPWAMAKFNIDSFASGMCITMILASGVAIFEELMSERLLKRLQGETRPVVITPEPARVASTPYALPRL